MKPDPTPARQREKPRCLILDDEPLARKGLAADLSQIGLIQVQAMAADAGEALQKLAAQPVDLLFLDLEFAFTDAGRTSGPPGLRLLETLPVRPLVILVTAYPQYALAGYEHGVIDYLVKPVSIQRLRVACEKAVEQILLRRNAIEPHLYVKCNNALERIPIADLLYIEAANNYILLHTITKKCLVYQSLKGIGQQLPPDAFVQVHKSFLVARRHILRIDGNHVIVTGTPTATSTPNGPSTGAPATATLPLSRRFKARVFAGMQLTNKTRPLG